MGYAFWHCEQFFAARSSYHKNKVGHVLPPTKCAESSDLPTWPSDHAVNYLYNSKED